MMQQTRISVHPFITAYEIPHFAPFENLFKEVNKKYVIAQTNIKNT